MNRSLPFLGVGLLALLCGLYWPGLNGPFLFDDYASIVHNEAIRINSLAPAELLKVLDSPGAGPLGRGVVLLSFALGYFFHGLDPLAFKLTNLLLHFVNAVLIGLLARQLLSSPRLRVIEDSGMRRWFPAIVAVLWLLHPINMIPVIMPVQRMTILATSFGLLTLLLNGSALATSGGRSVVRYLLAWCIFWPLALFSKETAVLVPLLALLTTYFSLPPRSLPWRFLTGLFLLAVAVVSVLAFSLGWGWLEQAYAMRNFTLGERLLTEARVLWFYVFQILSPRYEQFAFYLDGIEISSGWFEPVTTVVAVLAWVAVLLLVWRYRQRSPLVVLGVLWFLVGHLLESTIIPLEIAYEHRNYLPSFGLLLALLGWLNHIFSSAAGRRATKVLPVLILLIAGYLSGLTWMRSNHFSDGLRFAILEAEYHPMSPRANVAAAAAMMDAGFGMEEDYSAHAIRFHLMKAKELDGTAKTPHLYLIIWACTTKRGVEDIWVDDLEKRLRNSPFAPADVQLAEKFLRVVMGAPECLGGNQVRRLFLAVAERNNLPNYLRAHFLEALSDYELLVSRDIGQATTMLARAVELMPGDRNLRNKLAGYGSVPRDLEP